MLMCIQILVKFCPLVLKILSGDEILTSIKGCNSAPNLRKMTLYDPNLGLRAVEDVLKPPGSLLATDRSKAVVLVQFLLNVFWSRCFVS